VCILYSALDVDLDSGDDDMGAMYSAGLGVLADLGDSDVALRAEYRRRSDSSLDDTLSDNLFSLGVQIPFGKTTPKVIDSDGDGVSDSNDRCPNTPPGVVVGSDGCEIDSDGDGVVDSQDKCPGTPSGVSVDGSGCPLDSDGDGVTDDKDKCPGTVAGAPVDADGCELDSDNDGVVDRLDECPDSRPGAQVDVKGCEIKDEIRLPGVNFTTNSDELLPGAESVLDDAAASLIKNPSIRVEVQGHTDSDGAAAYNQNLSERRAITVLDYLASKGVERDRLTARGYGEVQPIADNSTAEGKAANRRVVLSIVAR
ncbi:MAG: OmpA family protein, partial [Pseudomonadota bacterium]